MSSLELPPFNIVSFLNPTLCAGFFKSCFWLCSLIFIMLSMYLLCCIKKSDLFYIQIASGFGMFITSKIGRTFLGFN